MWEIVYNKGELECTVLCAENKRGIAGCETI